MKVSESIAAFLKARATPANADLIGRWSVAMETQVNVSSAGGTPVDGKRNTFTDGVNEWFGLRIPHHADSEPTFSDYAIKWPLDLYADGIGCTGWNWIKRCSEWVGFDVDSLVAHASGVGITDEALERVKQAAFALPYVEYRKSTGGSGAHLYVYLGDIPTDNHTEHAALARCILGMMSSDCNFDFASQIDCCGGIMWIWHKKMTVENGGLTPVKAATKKLTVDDLPANWKANIEVVTRKRAKTKVQGVDDATEESFNSLVAKSERTPLEPSHKNLIDELTRSGYSTVWSSDHHLLQTHTCALQDLMERREELGLKGIFRTSSQGRDKATCNCFGFPIPGGGWRIYRFSPGTSEDPAWTQDGVGWTTTSFNRRPDLHSIAMACNGAELPKKAGYQFSDEDAASVLAAFGVQEGLPEGIGDVSIKMQSDKSLVITARNPGTVPAGWGSAKKNEMSRVVRFTADAPEPGADTGHDDEVRALTVPGGGNAGYITNDRNHGWSVCSKDDCKDVLVALGVSKDECQAVLGHARAASWRMVNLPFQPEYPGGRTWNKESVQYKCQPSNVDNPTHPTWDLVLKHCFQDLDENLKESPWAQAAGVTCGADYGLLWVAFLLRDPAQKLPYLFLYGDENCGKSSFHEAFEFLITKGYVSANLALTNQNGFNGELAGAVLASIEELDISGTKGALSKIKDWVLAPAIQIRQMRTDAYSLPNTLHFVQVANNPMYCPVFPGDTRITMINVPPLPEGAEIDKETLRRRMMDEAPQFMQTVMGLTLPEPAGRLRLPVITTKAKARAQANRKCQVENFLLQGCEPCEGSLLDYKSFAKAMHAWDETTQDTTAQGVCSWLRLHTDYVEIDNVLHVRNYKLRAQP